MSFQTGIGFCLMLNTKEDILKIFVEPNSCWSPLTSIVEKEEILWKSVIPTVRLPASFNISYFMLNKKETHTSLEQHDGEKIMTKFSFWGELSL